LIILEALIKRALVRGVFSIHEREDSFQLKARAFGVRFTLAEMSKKEARERGIPT
jgi:hypothetical protein